MFGKAWPWLGALTVVTAIVAWYGVTQRHLSTGKSFAAELATPPGVTLQALHAGNRLGVAASGLIYADADGETLYWFDKDTDPGRSACAGDCFKRWHPLAASDAAKPFGDWSMAKDRQWMVKGRRLYRCADDAHPGDTKCDGTDGVWHAATFQPGDGLSMPFGIALRELPNGGGQGFVDERGLTLYARDSSIQATSSGRDPNWKPALAPEMADRVGDFAAVTGTDGVRRWTYKGWPLYTFVGDLVPGDVNGAGADSRFQVALAWRYFMPPGTAISHNAALGDILTTGDGLTLYARDRFIDTDGHDFRTDHGTPATGRALGTAACAADCLHSWHPLPAPAGASPSGYWEIFTRADGTRQWAYKGYALYSYGDDHASGDVNGNERYALNPLNQNDSSSAPPGGGLGALFWRAATP